MKMLKVPPEASRGLRGGRRERTLAIFSKNLIVAPGPRCRHGEVLRYRSYAPHLTVAVTPDVKINVAHIAVVPGAIPHRRRYFSYFVTLFQSFSKDIQLFGYGKDRAL